MKIIPLAKQSKARNERWGAGQNAAPDEARERIIQAAWVCYAQRSPENTTMEHIAAQAQIGRATLYRYFPNRESVLRAVFRGAISEFLTRLRQASGTTIPFCEFFLHYMVYIVLYGPEMPLYRMFFTESTALWVSRTFLSDQDSGALMMDFFEAPFTQARERGEIAEDVDLAELIEFSGRLLMSMLLIPGEPVRNEAQLRAYFERHVIRGIRPKT